MLMGLPFHVTSAEHFHAQHQPQLDDMLAQAPHADSFDSMTNLLTHA
jgi:hypothetical protein